MNTNCFFRVYFALGVLITFLVPLSVAKPLPWHEALFGDPAETLPSLKESFEEAMKENDNDHTRPVVALASALVGSAASRAGNHEEALEHLESGLKSLTESVWKDVDLRVIEYQLRLDLASSLQELDRIPESFNVLDSLVDRTKAGLEKDVDAAAAIFGYPKEDGVDLKATLPKHEWLVTLNERLGKLEAARENWAAAEQAFQNAGELLRRIDPSKIERSSSLEKARKEAASKQGKVMRPLVAGRFGNPYTLRIKGAETFTPQEIKSALARSYDYVMASHPESEFESFLAETRRFLERGFQALGFAKPSIQIAWDETSAEVVVTIEEGPRFRAGQIHLEYAGELADPAKRSIPEDQLRASLAPLPNVGRTREQRANAGLREIAKIKKFPNARLDSQVSEVFHGMTKEKFRRNTLAGHDRLAPEFGSGKWNSGRWIDFDPWYREQLDLTIQSLFAEQGLFSPDMDLTFRKNPGAENTNDLVITLRSEGRPLRVGHVTVKGLQNNSEAQLLALLQLEEGMPLKGPWVEKMERSLSLSGRFVGWNLIYRMASEEARSGEVDLFIKVEELWSAPPLSVDLNPEQKALSKVVDWLNSEAGITEDLVVNLTVKHSTGPVSLRLALNAGALTASIVGLEHEIHLVLESRKDIEIFTLNKDGSFHTSLPIENHQLQTFFNLFHSPQMSPFLKTGKFNFGIGFSFTESQSDPSNQLKVLVDPIAITMMDTLQPVIKDDELILKTGPWRMRFDAGTGRLRSVEALDSGQWLDDPIIAKMEVGAVTRIRQEIKEKARKADNGKPQRMGPAPAFKGLFYLMETFQLFGEDEALKLSPEDFMARASERAKKREPLAGLLGEVTSTLWRSGSRDAPDEKPTDSFDIPSTYQYAGQKAAPQPGSTGLLILTSGIFDLVARNFEPGSWPELVVRESISYADGNSSHLLQSLIRLLTDEKMGPIGCLICADLLEKIKHPGAFDFLAKAEENFDEKGFEKDWRLLFSGTKDPDGPGWAVLKSLQKMGGPELDRLLPSHKSLVREIALKAAEVTPLNKESLLRPTMNALWKDDLQRVVRQNLNEVRKNLLANWDPELVAAVVNGKAIPRAAINLRQKTSGDQPNALGMNHLDDSIASLLLAEDIWKTGKSPRPEAIDQAVKQLVTAMGGWEQLEQLGFTRKSLPYWIGVLISQQARTQEILSEQIVSEKEARRFFENSSFLKNKKLIHVHTITLFADGNLPQQQEKAAEIRERIIGSTRGKIFKKRALKESFVREAKLHSMDGVAKNGGCRGWAVEQSLPAPMIRDLAQIEDGALSEVLTVVNGKKGIVSLILIPDARRPIPFEKAKAEALLGAYVKKLFIRAQISRFPKLKPIDPRDESAGNKAFENLGQTIENWLEELELPQQDSPETEEEGPHPFAQLPLPERVARGAASGRADDLYTLGTFAERGISPEKNGLPEAVRLYLESAGKGDVDAMLRLAELYRTGHGVAPDPAKAKEWKERAAKALNR